VTVVNPAKAGFGIGVFLDRRQIMMYILYIIPGRI